MKTTVWIKRNVVIFIGGDEEKNVPPLLTIEMVAPQIIFDEHDGKIKIIETK
jgi:hypothetical protein